MVASTRELRMMAAGAGGSPRVMSLAAALDVLLRATDDVAVAVQRHDRAALETANGEADRSVTAVSDAAAALSDDDRFELLYSRVPALCERLRAAARRNAYLIESAWAFDAAEMRLLAGLGRMAANGGLREYATPAGPAYVDRGA